VWALAAAANDLCLTPKSDPDSETPWARHPFGRQLLESLLAHYCHLHDVQTLAMLCSVFDASLQPLSNGLSSCHPFPPRSTHSRYVSPFLILSVLNAGTNDLNECELYIYSPALHPLALDPAFLTLALVTAAGAL
ncbi:hypothetical protein GDO81_026801, partial [Engystomops pustulosus]